MMDAGRTGFTRRGFLGTSAGLVVGLYVAPRLARGAPEAAKPSPLPPPNTFLRVGDDDSVTVLLSHSEMGQGVWTTLPMLVAEELGCELSQIHVEHAPAAPAYGHPMFQMQMTGGSSSTWAELDRYRQVGAIARTLLIQAAAEEWKVPPSACRVEKGHVLARGKKLPSARSPRRRRSSRRPPR
jgi:isoquinoline 1-oxidoreductase subunit beta